MARSGREYAVSSSITADWSGSNFFTSRCALFDADLRTGPASIQLEDQRKPQGQTQASKRNLIFDFVAEHKAKAAVEATGEGEDHCKLKARLASLTKCREHRANVHRCRNSR